MTLGLCKSNAHNFAAHYVIVLGALAYIAVRCAGLITLHLSVLSYMQDVTPGKITYIKPTSSQDEAKEQLALYKPADLRESSVRLRAGDKVEFSLVQQDSLNEELATDVVLLPRVASAEQDGGQLKGCVISLKEGFGFIRCASPVTLVTAQSAAALMSNVGPFLTGRLLLHAVYSQG